MGGFGEITCRDFCGPFKLLFSHGSHRSNMVRLTTFYNLIQVLFTALHCCDSFTKMEKRLLKSHRIDMREP